MGEHKKPAGKILIVEDDRTLLETLTYNFTNEGYSVISTTNGATGLEMGKTESPDLIILDVMLPELDGLSVCRILRRTVDTPIILLTARSGDIDKIIGLDSGADDYITKPFSLGELLARVRVTLRRKGTKKTLSKQLTAGDLTIDLTGRKVAKKTNPLSLSHKEFDLLVELVKNKGAVLSRDMLLSKIWEHDYIGETRTVDVHVRWLREKIEDDASHPERILTIRGIGYRFEG